MRRASPFLLATGCVMLAAAPAAAQSIDYGALEQLFGEPVTTSATGAPQRARDVPAEMEIVTADDIRRSGAIDIPGVLAHVVGMDVQRWTNLGADISARGYDSPFAPRMLVLINGRQVYLDDYGRTEWAALPLELSAIRQIEIVKGANSALFGFNAAGGVINIITYNPLYDTVRTATFKGGTQEYLDGSAVATARYNDDVAVRLSAGGTRTRDFHSMDALAAHEGLPQVATREEASADAHWRISSAAELELEMTHGADARFSVTPVWYGTFTQNDTNSILGRYTGDTAVGVITATAYSNWSQVKATANIEPPIKYSNQLTVATLQDVLKPGADHTVRVALEYRHSSINTAPVTGGRVSYDIGSVGGMWNWNVLPSVSLTAAGRLDELWLHRAGPSLAGSGLDNGLWDRSITEPSYNLGAVWRVDQSNTLRLSVARGVQLPSLLEFGAIQDFGPYFALDGNANIKTTIIDNYEIDWDRALPAIDAQARTALFFQTTRDIQSLVDPLTLTQAPAGYFLAFTGNIGNSAELGAEFSLKGSIPGGWRWQLAYTPRLVHDAYLSGASYATNGIDFQKTTPRHIVNAALGWSGGNWEADGFIRVQSSASGLFTQNEQTYSLVPLGATLSVDGRVAYHVAKGFTLSLTGQNVLFSSARQTSFGKTAQRILGALSVDF